MSLGHAKGKQFKAWPSQYNGHQETVSPQINFEIKMIKPQNTFFKISSKAANGIKMADPILEFSLI